MEIPQKYVVIFWHNWWKDKPIWQRTTFKDEKPNHEASSTETVKPEAVAVPEPVIFHQEKEISLDDNDDDFLPETETPAALAPSEPVIFHEEKEISLDDDDDEPQYEEEKLQVNIRDEFELEFTSSSEPELWKCRAELGHINFRAETELTIPTICMSKNHNFVPLSSL